ncbi:MAG TPA: 4-(cytidine 5'-diphospho)-2-C-methyl-D-erythritol kinase [Terriglobia bacterium]|nr:4-(cytidine 5'-diphospho)-2-C-methyl-D-erythritol kinase [Terriglobia bacterium]
MPRLRLRAFAKINLGLRILGRRPDGYHEIRTVYQAISLADRLQVSLGPRAGEIVVETDDPAIPQGPGNLVYRACERWRSARRLNRGIRIFIEKTIPAGSGLGGASSDAAAALLALERLTGDRLAPAALWELAAELGSDVPFFLTGGRALGCGRGEEVYPLPDLPARRCLVVSPGFAQSTAEAYAAAGSGLTPGAGNRSIYSFGMWPQFPWEDWGPAENDFEDIVFAKWPELRRLKRQLLRAGAEMASLSGSGTAVYAIVDSARKLASARTSVPAEWRSFSARTLSRAAYGRLRFEPN